MQPGMQHTSPHGTQTQFSVPCQGMVWSDHTSQTNCSLGVKHAWARYGTSSVSKPLQVGFLMSGLQGGVFFNNNNKKNKNIQVMLKFLNEKYVQPPKNLWNNVLWC